MENPKSKVTNAVVQEEIANTLAERRVQDQKYMKSKRPLFLKKLKGEQVETVYGSKAYEPYFGSTYTAFCNTVPVTIRFNGTEQKFPASIAQWLRKKIEKTTEANAPKKIDDLMMR